MDVPGYLGYSVIGDKSLEFVHSPRSYIARQRELHGDVFKARILNRMQIFITSNEAVHDLLINKATHFSMAYHLYLKELFDDVLLFLEGDAWRESREILETAFNSCCVSASLDQIKSLIGDYIEQLTTNEPVELYQVLKELSTHISISLFLSHDIDGESAKEISSLMTAHWRGIISVPLPIRIPWLSWKLGYSKALEAKDKLLQLIVERLNDKPSNIASEVSGCSRDKETAANHLLLFVSALIPKAMSSLLTSAIVELSKDKNVVWQSRVQEEAAAEHVLLEVERLWPPFFGGARVCNQSCVVAGYSIPKDSQVAYISYFANRDDRVFPRPDTFYPERWTNENVEDKEKVWTFGGGVRKCIGNLLVDIILKECLQRIARTYRWELAPNQDLDYKTLPISRPKQDIQVIFTRRT